jgi:DNA-binding TFAR19-related protein (PDSD5 family)
MPQSAEEQQEQQAQAQAQQDQRATMLAGLMDPKARERCACSLFTPGFRVQG